MISPIKRFALYFLAVAVGAAAFTFVCLTPASAQGLSNCPNVCYQGRTYYYSGPSFAATVQLANGGVCKVCTCVSCP